MPRNNAKQAEGEKLNMERKGEKIQSLRGMRDVLPEEAHLWNHVLKIIESVATDFRFERIVTPALEPTALFTRSVGHTVDHVEQELYSFRDRSDEGVTLRPEFTASLARAYLEHGMHNRPQPVRLWDVGPVFRQDSSQARRFRQFWQFDFEIIGDPHPVIDATLINAAATLYREIGLPVEVLVNSLGDANCRIAYTEAVQQYARGRGEEFCADCLRSAATDPLRMLGCMVPGCKAALAGAPQIVDWLCEGCRLHFIQVLEFLDELDIPYSLETRLTCGHGSNTRTAFEVIAPTPGVSPAESHGSPLALGGGGRYDNLIGEMGGRSIPAVGFAGGIERIVRELGERRVKPASTVRYDVFIAQLGADARKRALVFFQRLREQGLRVAESFCKDGLSAQLETAARLGCRITLILGQKELVDHTIIIRDMESGIQEIVDFDKIEDQLKKRIAVAAIPLHPPPLSSKEATERRIDLKKEEYIIRESITDIEETENSIEDASPAPLEETDTESAEDYEGGHEKSADYILKWPSEEYEEDQG